ncbi:uncharacterized protein P174DRAFT_462047 [Aspergillus novofumigatus IBT 16806]|uniref:LysM domain-containing protein n=1 Tax=Aspergillus novofumigatus (strain IBT 16806) TaxID=1392255 RepID=A0A2I1C1I7_ASPN1|nr:uncharacterized protein P174DRAFT_462047 [Aspergillus novofumigatus IBT 16806]PKX91504.1 hypothetical protein P174DRAFT_462047 [Aspergillus novofumigatus IBT 16806]
MQLTHLTAAGFIPGLAYMLSHHTGLSINGLQLLNPSITCPGLDTSKLYYMIGTITDNGLGTTLTTTISTTTTRTTTTTLSALTHSLTMPGIIDNYNSFYKISSGNQCDTIAKAHSISIAQLRSWNSEINNNCSNLWLDYYICIHVPSIITMLLGALTPTSNPSGPTPYGDSCWSIYTKVGVILTQLCEWNIGLNAACSNL